MNVATDLARLNVPESRLVKAAEADGVADLRRYADGEPAVIRAQVLKELCAAVSDGRSRIEST